MLKALELIGFKSFADKTRFEFPPGITVVVGPNGSGKSNIVDAIKWVLGEQSAKSLRGKDMADVIFKGSGIGNRKVINTAEVTIVFDNSQRHFPVDAPEMHVTRRVYRSGEGEYLINGQPCRLKDIRDSFRGTGVGTDAYSLIEQGRVDQLLQASSKDRRAIFEEAAGISRFKAKKIEAQRRLDRVDQNLLRLSDIVDEVDNRLRSVRNQASKARRYRENSDRLQQLRTQVGLTDWHQLTETLTKLESELSGFQNQVDEHVAAIEAGEAQLFELETEITTGSETLRLAEAKSSRTRELIASQETHIAHERSRITDAEADFERSRTQILVMSTRAEDLVRQLTTARESLASAESAHTTHVTQTKNLELRLTELTDTLSRLRQENERRRSEHLEAMRSSAGLSSQLKHFTAELESLEQKTAHLSTRLKTLETQIAQSHESTDAAQRQESQITTAVEELIEQLTTYQHDLDAKRQLFVRQQEELFERRSRLSGLKERAAILDELEKNNEGLSDGVAEVLEFAKQNRNSGIEGIVADLIQVDLDSAPLIDAALAQRAQFIVLTDSNLTDRIIAGTNKFEGRVGFFPLQDLPDVGTPLLDDLSTDAEVLECAEARIITEDRFSPLVKLLLGNTWIVTSLQAAVRLSKGPGRHCRFVTTASEVLESDGSLVVGKRDGTTGLISRRSELRAIQEDIAILSRQIEGAQNELTRTQENLSAQEKRVHGFRETLQELNDNLAQQRATLGSEQKQLEQLIQQQESYVSELAGLKDQNQRVLSEKEATESKLKNFEQQIGLTEKVIHDDQQQIEEFEQEEKQQLQSLTSARVDLAKSEQHLDSLQFQAKQLTADQRERNQAVAETRTQLVASRQRKIVSERVILGVTSELATLYLQKDRLLLETRLLLSKQSDHIDQRSLLFEEVKGLRKKMHAVEEDQHRVDLACGEIRHERHALAERLRDDYGIEIANATTNLSTEEQQERVEVEQEISELRRKISNIGAVNMEALNELDTLEERFNSLSHQYNDLNQAKESLERIIHKINADSRRVFSETLEIIRQNFQTLYRRAFGGGNADLVLEEGVDILESGIEIIATPPGKPSFNNSLLSGGEKALTAVALLLAIFEFRPSPFCVLDEVDAPFDEANVGRFIEVLRDFLKWTKFVIVTHSKKTMTAATTLYGVTMQESGVSKQVSVRFEDVSEDGEINAAAVEREANVDDSELGVA